MYKRKGLTKYFKNYDKRQNLTDFAVISLVSPITFTSVAVNSIITDSSVLTRIWVTVIFIYKDIIEIVQMLWHIIYHMFQKIYEIILSITNFAIISLVSRNTITSVAVNSIQTNSSVLTRIWITVICI